jgi:putative DNA primase/helicase
VNWGNYDDVLQQLRDAGLLVDSLDVGKRQRCRVDGDKEKRGWYHLHELRLDSGAFLLVGSFGVWRGNDPGSTRVELAKGTPMSAEQRAALKARVSADRKAEELARRADAGRAATRAQAMWRRLEAEGDSEYLRRKCVQAHGLRYSTTGTLVIPMLDAGGQIHGLQLIYPAGHARRKRLGRDKDFWPRGIAKQGHFFMIGSPTMGAACLVAEGYATAASLYEATGLPVAVAFDAGNLVHVAAALRNRHKGLRLLICADDDYLGKCRECGAFTLSGQAVCSSCGKPHGLGNAGVSGAHAAALAVDGAVLTPTFGDERPLDKKGHTDFNDLHVAEGLQLVRAQVEARLSALKWTGRPQAAPTHSTTGEGDAAEHDLRSIATLEELYERYALVYEASDMVFDGQEHVLVPLASMRNLCTSRQMHRNWMESVDKRVVRLREVGFDPSERDETIRCNLWGGWPTTPQAGRCDKILDLGEYLCSQDGKAAELWRWLQCWLAYPIQHPGAKMKTAVIMHGPQGTGKNLFFEAVAAIYAEYSQIVDQDAVEDKHNDFMSRKLLLIADEVVARQEMYHSKNKLKGLITSDWIRINPKHLASYRERNHVQVVFLSNEVQPMALERDDRRYAVIWTPPKYEADIYNQVIAEINGGGIAALHDYLLKLDLGDFGPATLPPVTQAKKDLIELGLDSSERFFNEWQDRHLPLSVVACRSEDLYSAYRHWCGLNGVGKPAQLSTFIGTVAKRPGVQKGRHQHYKNFSKTVEMQSVVITPAGAPRPEGKELLADSINDFNTSLKAWKDEVTAEGTHGERKAERAGQAPTKPRQAVNRRVDPPPETFTGDDDEPY